MSKKKREQETTDVLEKILQQFYDKIKENREDLDLKEFEIGIFVITIMQIKRLFKQP